MPSPRGAVDLRSDTVTTPTAEMRAAMADAEVGDDAYGEDPTVNRLQSLAAGRRACTAAAVRHDRRGHCGGARSWNAAIARQTEPAALVRGCDTVMFCLSKGLGAPVGSRLCGPADLIGCARTERARLGGG